MTYPIGPFMEAHCDKCGTQISISISARNAEKHIDELKEKAAKKQIICASCKK